MQKALIDSGLGSSVIGEGVDDGLLQVTFSVGLKDIESAVCGEAMHDVISGSEICKYALLSPMFVTVVTVVWLIEDLPHRPIKELSFVCVDGGE